MTINPLIIISGEPYSIFLEIFFKSLKNKKVKKIKNPIIIICSKKLLIAQMKRLGHKYKINEISKNDFKNLKKISNTINIINVEFKFRKVFDKISKNSNAYLKKCFEVGINLARSNKVKALINGPISKENFLNKKYPGMTEYFAKKTNCSEKETMLIYNKHLSVSPLTTHLPLKKIFKKITKKKLIKQIKTIHSFYKNKLDKIPTIGITGLNPHCETTDKFSEEKKIIIPAIKKLKENIRIYGPYSADTLFMKKNLKKFDVIVGMYHDQVLTPIKTIYEFNAINITLGLPFLRITPDHGTNNKMVGKNLSNPTSLVEAILFSKNLSEN